MARERPRNRKWNKQKILLKREIQPDRITVSVFLKLCALGSLKNLRSPGTKDIGVFKVTFVGWKKRDGIMTLQRDRIEFPLPRKGSAIERSANRNKKKIAFLLWHLNVNDSYSADEEDEKRLELNELELCNGCIIRNYLTNL